MKNQTAQQKGKEFEKLIAKEIEEEGLGAAKSETGSGSGKRKGDVAANLPFLIEAKNQKAIPWWASIDQAKHQAEIGNYDRDKWALVVRDPRSPEERSDIYVVMDFWKWLKLLKKDSAPRIKEPDRNLKWKLKTLKAAISQVEKLL